MAKSTNARGAAPLPKLPSKTKAGKATVDQFKAGKPVGEPHEGCEDVRMRLGKADQRRRYRQYEAGRIRGLGLPHCQGSPPTRPKPLRP
jgi:hypothetical protein